MPVAIFHIDQIARKKQRDVLYVEFSRELTDRYGDCKDLPIRQEIVRWLNSQGIAWLPCAHFASEHYMESYCGQIYLEVPFDERDEDYKKLIGFFEKPDGTMRIPGVTLCYVPLEAAMRNAHHDEPGFWDRWAERF